MRPLLFRQKLKPAYVHNNEQFHYWGHVEDELFISPCGKNDVIGDSEQFTEMHHSGGEKSFEGDIVKFITSAPDVKIGVVAYYAGAPVIHDGKNNWHYSQINCENYELVGNKHENPELYTKILSNNN